MSLDIKLLENLCVKDLVRHGRFDDLTNVTALQSLLIDKCKITENDFEYLSHEDIADVWIELTTQLGKSDPKVEKTDKGFEMTLQNDRVISVRNPRGGDLLRASKYDQSIGGDVQLIVDTCSIKLDEDYKEQFNKEMALALPIGDFRHLISNVHEVFKPVFLQRML